MLAIPLPNIPLPHGKLFLKEAVDFSECWEVSNYAYLDGVCLKVLRLFQ